MKLAIIGYGKMGRAIERMALDRGHTVVCTIDNDQEWHTAAERWAADTDARPDVAVEFSTPATAAANLHRCFEAGVPVVCGTTGWYSQYNDVADDCRARRGALLAATNFSIGMNIMFALNEQLARLMQGRSYRADITEIHHIHKLDAPSGTALTLQEQIAACGGRQPADVPITSIREGEVPGTHTVRYDSPVDTITLTHEAHSREGLAQGALLAAEWLQGREGVYSMRDLLADSPTLHQ